MKPAPCRSLIVVLAVWSSACSAAPGVVSATDEGPLVLKPDRTTLVLRSQAPQSVMDAARFVSTALRRAYGVKSGFDIEHNGADIEGHVILAVQVTPDLSSPDGVLIERRGRSVVLAGGSERAVWYAAREFLDVFCGIRFYLPDTLFVSRPTRTPIVLDAVRHRTQPYTQVVNATGFHSLRQSRLWARLHGLDRRESSHQHTMFARFPPERFADRYPKIYPVYEGHTYIPASSRDQQWQPCFSEPTLVDAAEESAAVYFESHPDARFIAFSIQDSRRHCDHDIQSSEVAEHGVGPGMSRLYWRFMNRLAQRLERRWPDKKIVGLAYGHVRSAPPWPLHRNVLPWLVFKMSDIDIDKGFDQPAQYLGHLSLPDWAGVAQQVGLHDWAHGKGYLIPRLYTRNVERTFVQFEKLGISLHCLHVECYPNWGLDGPKYYLLARLCWDPHADVDALLAQFCADMFGPAADPMRRYFTGLERLYDQLNRKRERRLNRWREQLLLDADDAEVVRELRGDLDRALSLAPGGAVRQRIELFSKTFHYSECLFDLANAPQVEDESVEALRAYVRDVIAADPRTVYQPWFTPGFAENQLESVLKQLQTR